MQFGKAFDKKELKHLQKYFSFVFLITIDFLFFDKNNILNHYNKYHNIIEI